MPGEREKGGTMIIDRIFCVLIFLCSWSGLYLQSGIPQKQPRRHMFVYYTNQSNAVIGIYSLLLFAGSFSPEGALYRALALPTVRFCLTLMIWVTHIIYHFLLVPSYRKDKKRFEDNRNGFGNACVHYIAPLLTLVQWVLCADKGITFVSCLVWLIIPVSYSLFVIIRGRSGLEIGNTGSAYPYSFMDMDVLGAKKFFIITSLVLCFFFLLALALFGAVKLFEFVIPPAFRLMEVL